MTNGPRVGCLHRPTGRSDLCPIAVVTTLELIDYLTVV